MKSFSHSLSLVRFCTEKPTRHIFVLSDILLQKKENAEGKTRQCGLLKREKRRTSSRDAGGRRKRREYRLGIMNQKRAQRRRRLEAAALLFGCICFFFFVYTNHIDTKEIHISHMLHSLLTNKEKKTTAHPKTVGE